MIMARWPAIPASRSNLRFVEKARLDRGKVMLYRAHRDIHLQLPADDMSVSLNILETSSSAAFRDQYRFDLETSRIAAVMTRMTLEPMLALAAHFGGEAGEDLLADFAAGHPSDRVRWLRAEGARGRPAGARRPARASMRKARARAACWSPKMARREAERIEAGRAWIAAPPPRRTALADALGDGAPERIVL